MDTATNNTLLLLTVDKQKFQDLLSINCSQKKTSLIFNSVNKLDEISVNKFLNNLNH